MESLAHTVGIEADVLQVVDVLRKKRHLSDCIRAGAVSQQEADEAIALAIGCVQGSRSGYESSKPISWSERRGRSATVRAR